MSHLPLSKDQISWIAPLLPIGIIIGNFLNSILIDRIGRKWTLLLFSIPQMTSWLLIFLAKNYVTIYFARIMGGIGYGGGICAVTVYLSEIGNRKNRGIFISLIKLSSSLGIFETIVLGAYLSYNYMNLCLLMMPIIFAVFFSFMPDSTYFWKKNNQRDEEMKIRLNLLKPENFEKNENYILNEVILKEDSKLKEKEDFKSKQNFTLNEDFTLKEGYNFEENLKLNEDSKSKKHCRLLKLKESNFWKLFSLPNNLRAMLIIFCVTANDSLSGHMAYRYFTQQMLTYSGSFLPPEKATIALADATVLASVIVTQVIEKFRRKSILLCTGMVASIAQAIVGTFFYLKEHNVDVSSISFIPFLGLLIFEFATVSGASTLFYIYQGELFTNDVKGMAITLSKVVHMIFAFISVIIYQLLFDSISTFWICFTFSIGGAVMCFVTLSITPETKGKTLSEIQVLLKTKKAA